MKQTCADDEIVLGDGTRLRILYEDRSVLAIDKPFGWMFVPLGWSKTDKNLQLALESSIRENPHWVRRKNIKYLRYVHRLDADTTGVVLLAKSQGALETMSDLFERRLVGKSYLAVVEGKPQSAEWRCELPLGGTSGPRTRVLVDYEAGKSAVTDFKVLNHTRGRTLIEAHPITGRTHQIRVHLSEAGFPIVGDLLYGPEAPMERIPSPVIKAEDKRRFKKPAPTDSKPENRRNTLPELGLRSVGLSYRDPFTKRFVDITAPRRDFLTRFGFRETTQASKPLTISP